MTVLEKENFRIQTIYNINTGEQSIKEGLCIEKQTLNESYYVICTVRYDESEEDVYIEIVGDRLLDIEDDEFKLFKELLSTARALVRLTNIDYSKYRK